MKVENTMRELSGLESATVSGGQLNWKLDLIDGGAGCAREPYMASYDAGAVSSWSIYATATGGGAVTSACYTVQIGPATVQTCINSDQTKTVQSCLQAGPSGSIGGVGLGVTGQVCSTTITSCTPTSCI